MRITTTMLALATAASLAVGATAAVADTGPAKRTAAGGFDTLAAGAGTGYERAHGNARIVRDGRAGTTTVHVVLNGLAANTHYGAHLHLGSCDQVGGHYKHDPAGIAMPPNELWPVLDTDHRGRARTSASEDWIARDEAGAVVVHDPATGAKVLCADL